VDEELAATRSYQRRHRIHIEPVAAPRPRHETLKDFLAWWVYESSLPRLLVCNDKMSMANSVEGRAPFLDHEFVDLAFSMSTDDLVVDGLRKYPLRDAMRDLVPPEILFRKTKDAFAAPVFDYLRNAGMRDRIRNLFKDPATAGVFDPQVYLANYEDFLAKRGGDRVLLLHGLFLEEWARTFDVEFA
jgi:asparagine synthase (glutamine-hydrolysing)